MPLLCTYCCFVKHLLLCQCCCALWALCTCNQPADTSVKECSNIISQRATIARHLWRLMFCSLIFTMLLGRWEEPVSEVPAGNSIPNTAVHQATPAVVHEPHSIHHISAGVRCQISQLLQKALLQKSRRNSEQFVAHCKQCSTC